MYGEVHTTPGHSGHVLNTYVRMYVLANKIVCYCTDPAYTSQEKMFKGCGFVGNHERMWCHA